MRHNALSLTVSPADEVVTKADNANPLNVRRLRFHGRIEVSIRARVLVDGVRLPVEIRNISRSGAGIRGSLRLPLDGVLSLELPDGRSISALLRWSRSGFFGVQFVECLSQSDPLFENGMETSARCDAPGQSAAVVPFPNQQTSDAERNRPEVAASWALLVTKTAWGQLGRLRRILRPAGPPVARERPPVMLERACRKQGFSWLSEE